jgi:hypothetical protein
VLQPIQSIMAGFHLTCNSYQPILPLLTLSEELQHCHFPAQEQAHCWKPSAANIVHVPTGIYVSVFSVFDMFNPFRPYVGPRLTL